MAGGGLETGVQRGRRRALLLPLAINLALCAIIYGIGIKLAVRGDPLAFARAGAAATAVGLALSLWDARRMLGAAARIERDALVDTVGQLCHRTQDADAIAAELERRLRGRFSRAERLTASAEAALLVIATLVWGFGDLAFAGPTA
jgi:hypothetical protein